MHNRKEGALALLAGHGAGAFFAGQKWMEYSATDVNRMYGAALAAGLFGFGAVTAYIALRHSGDEAHDTPAGPAIYSFTEGASAIAMGVVFVCFAIVGGMGVFPKIFSAGGTATVPTTTAGEPKATGPHFRPLRPDELAEPTNDARGSTAPHTDSLNGTTQSESKPDAAH